MTAPPPAPSAPTPLTLQSLPLFPLGTVLFPGGVLPLRVFEVRYLDMIRRCHAAGAPFGVVSLTQGHEVRQPGATEALADVGTLAELTDVSSPQPGLMLVRSVGRQRFRITRRERLKHGLWVADVEFLPDDPAVAVPDDLKAAATALQGVLDSLRQRAAGAAAGEPGAGSTAPADADLPIAPPYRWDDCGWLANRWCELLPVPTTLKQRLLELDSPLVRLELVNDLLGRAGLTGGEKGGPGKTPPLSNP